MLKNGACWYVFSVIHVNIFHYLAVLMLIDDCMNMKLYSHLTLKLGL